jgi:hypothetical protein
MSNDKVAAAPTTATMLTRCGGAARCQMPERWLVYEGKKAYSIDYKNLFGWPE